MLLRVGEIEKLKRIFCGSACALRSQFIGVSSWLSGQAHQTLAKGIVPHLCLSILAFVLLLLPLFGVSSFLEYKTKPISFDLVQILGLSLILIFCFFWLCSFWSVPSLNNIANLVSLFIWTLNSTLAAKLNSTIVYSFRLAVELLTKSNHLANIDYHSLILYFAYFLSLLFCKYKPVTNLIIIS